MRDRRNTRTFAAMLLLLLAICTSLGAGEIEESVVRSLDYRELSREIAATGTVLSLPQAAIASAILRDVGLDRHERESLLVMMLRSPHPQREETASLVLDRHQAITDPTLLELALRVSSASVSPTHILGIIERAVAWYAEPGGTPGLMMALSEHARALSSSAPRADSPGWRLAAAPYFLDAARVGRSRDLVVACRLAARELMREEGPAN